MHSGTIMWPQSVPLNKIRYTITRFCHEQVLYEIIQTSDRYTVNDCQIFFVFLPGSLIAKRTAIFLAKLNKSYCNHLQHFLIGL